jgi:hypothetical protein
MPDFRVFPYYIRVSRPIPESVPNERYDLYTWLARKLSGRQHVRIERRRDSVYLTSEQMRKDSPKDIWGLLGDAPDPAGRPSLVILDIATNSYNLFRQGFLQTIGEISLRWLQGNAQRRILILIPALPPKSSIFWHRDMTDAGDTELSSRLTVLANDGTSGSNWLGTADRHHYRSLQLASQGDLSTSDLRKRLEARIVRKIGHYSLTLGGNPHCARYFYDIDAAKQEIGDLIIKWAEENIRPTVSDGRFTLVSHGKNSPKFHEAVAGAALALDCPMVPLEQPEPPYGLERIDGAAALVLNVVHTGGTFQQISNHLREQRVTLAPEALTVLKTDPRLSIEGDYPALYSLCDSFPRQKISQAECHQCLIHLGHTSPDEDQVTFRSIDMWDMLIKYEWKQEKFGPRSQRRLLSYLPDMGRIFDTYGSWIAHKIGRLLERIDLPSDVVFVCPKEEHIERLVTQLGILRQNRQVTVQIPRPVLDSTNLDRTLPKTEDEEWHRQLRHLKGRENDNVVIIDEFVLSYSTVRSMINILGREEFQIKPRVYIPVIDFSVDGGIHGLETYPLYRLPHPRGNP